MFVKIKKYKKFLIFFFYYIRGGSNISCTMNHEGPFCSICATGYSMIGLDCKKCDNATLNTILLSIAIFGICVFLSILT